MRLAITPLAEQDLESIADYIAQDNPARAVIFVRELQGQCQRLVLNPPGYRLRPELGDGIRSCAHGRYVIFFVTTPDEVIVIRILHGAGDLPAVFHPDEP
ncbi:type II toxin-antitoxin system RelE/ParE family toxin [Ralstonia solanacearum]|uniref:type II toxin-antitoxin system RelE/ParE family toxin n=1 Tax=Ralstonia solanacearum TaxID=305 RepID=UPI0007C8E7F5|nr:type II toxin-antitoxin system RelE/ParE family toxin [Ralstonia solanacearum]OAI58581.1 plasmid stabilization protein [Ralstonia solanacearum]